MTKADLKNFAYRDCQPQRVKNRENAPFLPSLVGNPDMRKFSNSLEIFLSSYSIRFWPRNIYRTVFSHSERVEPPKRKSSIDLIWETLRPVFLKFWSNYFLLQWHTIRG